MIKSSSRGKTSSYRGLLFIGDPHLEGRQPGFRKDDFPNVVLNKLQWCLDYARQNRLLPALLGDVFDKPRDNPTWMLGRLMEMLAEQEVIGIYGNHDCAETQLTDDDSLSLLIKSGCFKLVSEDDPWYGQINERNVYVGGSSYRHPIPSPFEMPERQQSLFSQSTMVFWMTHHDIDVPGYTSGVVKPTELGNIDYLINGHIHRRLDPVEQGMTTWLTPGNISRRSRSDANRAHTPSVLRFDIWADHHVSKYVEVPHKPFDEVFHEAIISDPEPETRSSFVSGLAELMCRRTDTGAGLHEFLDKNLDQFEPIVAEEIRILAEEVTEDA